MIQRVQSIFLLLVAVSMGLMLGFDIWHKVSLSQGEAVELNAFYLTHFKIQNSTEALPGNIIEQEPAWYIAVLASLAAVVAVYSIFRYDNRLTQTKLGALNSLLIGITLAVCIWLSLQGDEMLISESQGTYQIGFYLPAVALVCNMLANRFIRKDEALVRSADRFR